ncbi:Cytochrome P450 76C4 [Linum perenne]
MAILLRFISTQTPANLPPGPSGLPIIGNHHNLGDQPHKSLADLAQIHGPLMSLKLGQVTTIVASPSHVAKEILQKHDQVLSDRQTTSSTLEWAMAELLRNPDTLIKAREAILKKTFKLHPTSPLLLPRKARSNVEICGFTMPRGAQILINVWAISRDPTTWNNPNSFMPERFMGSKTDVRGHNFELIPFGGGRRICPGLSLAMRMPHTMLGSLIHWFDWKLEDGVDPKSLHMEEKFGITLQKTKPLFVIPTTKLG